MSLKIFTLTLRTNISFDQTFYRRMSHAKEKHFVNNMDRE